jgi:hypothetical protein
MDFFVSKVAMSICALLIVAVLGAALGEDRFVDGAQEIRGIMEDLCDVAESAYDAGSEGEVTWTAPELSTGECLQLVIDHDGIHGHTNGQTIVCAPHCQLHTWRWDGTALNRSAAEALDERSDGFTVSSNDEVMVSTKYVMADSDLVLMVFVLPCP